MTPPVTYGKATPIERTAAIAAAAAIQALGFDRRPIAVREER
jgi:hypothetical protein